MPRAYRVHTSLHACRPLPSCAVVAVARKGERVRANPGDVCVQPGDILLLDTGAAFAQQHKVGCGTEWPGLGGWQQPLRRQAGAAGHAPQP